MKNTWPLVLGGIIFILLGSLYFIDHSNEKDSFKHFRDRTSQSEVIGKNTDDETSNKNKESLKNRKIAQSRSKVAIANPREKREELMEKNSRRGDSKKRSDSYPSDIAYADGNGNRYNHLKEQVAVKINESNEDMYPSATRKLGYFIIPVGEAPNDANLLLKNTETGRIAIFTGLIKVVLTDVQYIHSVIQSANYDVLYRYDHINLVMYKFDSFDKTMQVKKELDQSPYVTRATVELLEYERVEQ